MRAKIHPMRRLILSTMVVLPLVLLTPVQLLQANEFPGYTGGGVEEGVEQAEGFGTGGSGNVVLTVQNLIYAALSFLALAALIVVIVAGITLLIGGQSEEQRGKAKNMLLWGLVGILIILFASAIVRYVVGAMFN